MMLNLLQFTGVIWNDFTLQLRRSLISVFIKKILKVKIRRPACNEFQFLLTVERNLLIPHISVEWRHVIIKCCDLQRERE